MAEQIRLQIREHAATGRLGRGDRLPPVRQLARDLRLAPGTVAKAYQLLEAEAIVETRGRHGTFVAGTPARAKSSEASSAAEAAARRFLDECLTLGLSASQAAAVVRDVATGDPASQSVVRRR